jgi:hypothetical protein
VSIHILAQIICKEFRKAFLNQGGVSDLSKGMKTTFRLSVDHAREDGFRNLELLIFGGGSSYISVFAKLDWSVIPLEAIEGEDGLKPGYAYTEGSTPWVHFSCHDSCWTSDGVESVLHQFHTRLNLLECQYDRWYETVEMSQEDLRAFRAITAAADRGRAPRSVDFPSMEFRFDPPGKALQA